MSLFVWLRRTVIRLSSRSSFRQHCGKQPNHISNGDYEIPLSTASVSQCQWAPREAEAGGIVCSPASWAMACHCSARDTPCYPGRGCPMAKRGGMPYRAMGWPIILSCLHISQPRRGLVVQGLSPSVRCLSLCCRPLWQIYCCSRHLEWQPCHHGVSVCSCREAGASTFLPAKPPSCHANRHSLTSGG